MTQTLIRAFIQRVYADKALKGRLEEVNHPADFVQLAAEHGFEFTEVELAEFTQARQMAKEAQMEKSNAVLMGFRQDMLDFSAAMKSGEPGMIQDMVQRMVEHKTEIKAITGPSTPQQQQQAENLKSAILEGDESAIKELKQALGVLKDVLSSSMI